MAVVMVDDNVNITMRNGSIRLYHGNGHPIEQGCEMRNRCFTELGYSNAKRLNKPHRLGRPVGHWALRSKQLHWRVLLLLPLPTTLPCGRLQPPEVVEWRRPLLYANHLSHRVPATLKIHKNSRDGLVRTHVQCNARCMCFSLSPNSFQ